MNRGTTIKLHPSWLAHLSSEFDQPYMQHLKDFLQQEKQAGKTIYPKGSLIFNALNTTPLDQVKVVIIGQDPYHGPNQAHGLSFSVLPGIPLPPSLLNIFKELNQSLGLSMPQHGCLQSWAEQGVLLLNATLTVERGNAGSHQKKGWETFTDSVITTVNDQCQDIVFLLWGSYAQKKGSIIDTQKHYVLKSSHPSPLSAHRGFFGNRHFVKANEWLVEKGKDAIDWAI